MSDQVKLDEKVVTKEELKQIKEDLPNNQRIVEVEQEEFKTVTRMRG
jgi:hypothetical protein